MLRSAKENGNHHLIHPVSLTYPHLRVKDIKKSKEEKGGHDVCEIACQTEKDDRDGRDQGVQLLIQSGCSSSFSESLHFFE